MTRAFNKNKKPETNNKNRARNYSGGASAPLVVSGIRVFTPPPPIQPRQTAAQRQPVQVAAASYTILRLNARIPAHHAATLRFGRIFLQTVHPMLKKLFQSFRSPLRRTQHKRSTPEVLNSSQHSLQRAQFSRYAVNIVERLQLSLIHI